MWRRLSVVERMALDTRAVRARFRWRKASERLRAVGVGAPPDDPAITDARVPGARLGVKLDSARSAAGVPAAEAQRRPAKVVDVLEPRLVDLPVELERPQPTPRAGLSSVAALERGEDRVELDVRVQQLDEGLGVAVVHGVEDEP